MGEHVIQASQAHSQPSRLKPQVDDTSVRLAQTKDKLAKVSIISNQDALLLMGKRQYFGVFKKRGVVRADPGRIVT